MSLTPCNSLDNLFRLDSALDNFFYPQLSLMRPKYMRKCIPSIKIDMVEDEKEYRLMADMPGVSKENINIDFENGLLTITTERKQAKCTDEDKYLKNERTYGYTSRTLSVPSDIKEDINAKYVDGVLTITLEKTTAESKKKKITIE